MSVMDLTNAVLDLLPSMPSGVKVYRQEEPLESEMPPWIIARVSTDRHVAAETMRFTAHSALLEVRAVSTTADSVNIWCDDMLIPALANRSPPPAAGLHGRPAHPVRGFRRIRGRSDSRRHRAPLPGARPEVPLHVEPTVINQSFTKSLQRHPIRGWRFALRSAS